MNNKINPFKLAHLALFVFLAIGYAQTALAQVQEDKLPTSAIVFGANRKEESKLHSYFGLAPGYGQASGTQYPMNSGFAYGATFGLELDKAMGLAITYQHNSFSYSGSASGSKTTVHQLLAELNVFSLLVLNGGFHFADVLKLEPGLRTADFGFGVHIGLDVNLTPHLTAGIVGYSTFVLEQEDHHSILNLMVPLKYWF